MRLQDKFSKSGLEYTEWANKMVAEGKMYWPENTQNGLVAGNATHGAGELAARAAGDWSLTVSTHRPTAPVIRECLRFTLPAESCYT